MLNMAVVIGKLAQEPQMRPLSGGGWVASFDLKVNQPGQEHEVVPVAVMPEAAGEDVQSLVPGQELVVLGRVRRRFFRAGGATQSRTEVVADEVSLLEEPLKAVAMLQSYQKALLQAKKGLQAPPRSSR